MKDKILFAIALMCTMLFSSCGGGGSDDGGGSTPSRTSTYYMDVSMDATAGSQTIVLNNLNTDVSTAVSSASWLTPTRQAYTSGSPKITIEATANNSTSSRNCTVTVTALNGNKVIITVIQKGTSQSSDQPETNDEVSDQQPYSMDLSL
ncbi:MAG: BACON domain-containing protein [Prevotella sp.]|nr:BACON domain-containing protein [Prevotella sp.]